MRPLLRFYIFVAWLVGCLIVLIVFVVLIGPPIPSIIALLSTPPARLARSSTFRCTVQFITRTVTLQLVVNTRTV